MTNYLNHFVFDKILALRTFPKEPFRSVPSSECPLNIGTKSIKNTCEEVQFLVALLKVNSNNFQ